MLIIIILGMISLSRLPIDLMPDITYPVLSVSTVALSQGSRIPPPESWAWDDTARARQSSTGPW